ncbi:PEP-CTERM sorting domain-containing protein [Phycisphaerales bacterium AB-hyl4]|uniref:PEP-CTERM sorting domain-containing protein n=1 Tax=Natronomicrosphaera hydrolytica TaxID=3242702 RepID=A0ABV4U942_9BACT
MHRVSIVGSAVLCAGVLSLGGAVWAGPFAPAAGEPGSTAIHMSDPSFIGWATDVAEIVRGPVDIDDPDGEKASYGDPSIALGPANGTAGSVVSLGDGGHITLTFSQPITNGPGYDFAVFSNAFSDTYLELAFVEVSSDGENFIRFPNFSLTEDPIEFWGAMMDPTNIYGYAGKYRAGYGTPFDLDELIGQPGVDGVLDVDNVTHVRIVDVVGDGSTYDFDGNPVYHPHPTPFNTGGFDLDAVGVINVVPEPGTIAMLLVSGSLVALRRRRRLA